MRKDIPDETSAFAKSLRASATDAERKLWSMLRGKRLGGHKFRRQVPFDVYILDFVCFESRLVVEADGSQHSGSSRDVRRDAALAAAGFLTLRFWNNDILQNPNGVFLAIEEALKRKL